MIRMNPYFIVNPLAGGKRGNERWKEFASACYQRGIETNAGFTERRGHAMELARKAVEGGFDCVVAFGGDGTLNETLNGLLQKVTKGSSSCCLGFVGAGSSNDFLRSFCRNGGTFLENIRNRRTRTVDVGRIQCRDEHGRPVTRYFLVNSSLGLVPQALEFFNQQTWPHRFLKRLSLDGSVISSGLSAVFRHRDARYSMTEGTREVFSGTLTNIAVLKGPCFGGGMSYGVAAVPDKGHLSLVGIGPLSVTERLKAMVRFYQGTILDHPKVWKREIKSIAITSGERGIVEADGELVGFLPAKFSVCPHLLQMIV